MRFTFIIFFSSLTTTILQGAFFQQWSAFNQRMRAELWQSAKHHNTSHDGRNAPPSKSTCDKPSPKYSLAHIKGVVPQEIFDIRDYLRAHEHFDAVGARLPSGILLCGKPGTGKTSIARALASEVQVPFFAAKGSEFIEKYVGVGAQRIRELFDKARAAIKDDKAPYAIIFIDELDALGNRDSYLRSGEEDKAIGELLTQMDGFNKEQKIMVIGATNRKQFIDKALLRPGRFEEIIEIPLPHEATRLEILHHYLHDSSPKRATQGTLDLKRIAQATNGWSGAELESLINHAAIVAARAKRAAITQNDLDAAYEHMHKRRQ